LPWKRRLGLFGVWLLVLGGLLGGLAATTRWEGSLNGGAVPRLIWKWQTKRDRHLDRLEGSGEEASLRGEPGEFTQFLGPNRNGVLAGVALDPDWEAHPPRELWRREIGAGWSGFSVAAGRAVTQEQRGNEELVSCYDLGSGQPLWAHANETRFEEAMGGDGPRANPTIHRELVYAMGATGILDCLQLATGVPVWSRHILADRSAGNVMYGKACSPLIAGDLVIVTGGVAPGPAVLAFDRLTGHPVWSAGEDAASYASPVLATLAGREQIVSVNQNTVTGHDVATGAILWIWDWPAKMPKPAQAQPAGADRLFVSASLSCSLA
jgi:outer membrane protein assembly factor BamB